MSEAYKIILEKVGHGFWEWNPTTNVIHFSKQWKQMLGYRNDEITNSIDEWARRIHPDDFSQCFNELTSFLRGDSEHYRNEHRMLCKDGTYRWVLDQATIALRNFDGYPIRVVGTYTDIDELKSRLEYFKKLHAGVHSVRATA
jgi:PAS domain S-box-containing protein